MREHKNRRAIDTVEIPAGQAETPSIQLDSLVLAGWYYPTDWTAADISVQVSEDGTVWRNLPGAVGTFTGQVNLYQPVEPALFAGVNYVKLVSSVNQVAARELKVISIESSI